ncbi:MAG TPA: hypothetical protein PKA88_09600 [Polyangiaceae bacterium]|nr:hypothetical protein [Polyangiaceae bacterium]
MDATNPSKVFRERALALVALLCLACGSKSGLSNLDAGGAGGSGGVGGSGGTSGGAGSGGVGGVAASLNGLRWELPCYALASETVCDTDNSLSLQTTLSGASGQLYAVRLRIRGVLEEKSYSGGTSLGGFMLGGSPAVDDWNTYALTVSEPAQTLFLNPGISGNYYCVGVDDTVTLTMRGGATVRLWAEVYDAQQIVNVDASGKTILVPGVPPYPQAFNGQFAQVDVVDVQPI